MGSSLGTLTDLCTPWCVHVVATLRIAEHIAAGVDRTEDLAAAAQCDAGALHAVLGHLSAKGVFSQPEYGRFALNETSRELLEPSVRIGLDLNGIGGRMAHAWGTMLTYVRTGTPGYSGIFGRPFWEDLDAHPEIGRSFDELMGVVGHGLPDPNIEITGGWEPVRTVVDTGGGNGTMLAVLLRERPWLRGTLVDLPRAVALSSETFRTFDVSARAKAIGQSFFDPLPGGADVYLLRKVLNDWPDREAVAILTRCAEAARPDGRVVVMGGVGPEQACPRLTVEMLLAGGRQRTVTEFRELARAAGLDVAVATQQAAGFVVECRPAAGSGQALDT